MYIANRASIIHLLILGVALTCPLRAETNSLDSEPVFFERLYLREPVEILRKRAKLCPEIAAKELSLVFDRLADRLNMYDESIVDEIVDRVEGHYCPSPVLDVSKEQPDIYQHVSENANHQIEKKGAG